MTRPNQRANRAVLSRLEDHLAEGKNGGEPKAGELPVDDRTRIAIESVKALYAKQTVEYHQSLQAIAAAAMKADNIDPERYNFLDIDRMVWTHRAKG